MLDRLLEISVTHKWVHENQSGFTRKKEQRITFLIAFIDIKKAYDSVNKTFLKNLLNLKGIKEESIAFIKHFLGEREYVISINNLMGQKANFSKGLPQGSRLSPILFNILFDNCTNLNDTLAYADDVAIIAQGRSLTEAASDLNNKLIIFARKCKEVGLTISEEKSKVLQIGKSKDPNQITIEINNKALEQVNSYRYLGVRFDKNFSFNRHVEEIARKARKTCYTLNWLTNKISGLNTKNAITLYKTYIRSQMEYCSFIWSQANKTALDLLDKRQQSFLCKAIGTSRITMREQVNLRTKILPLELRRCQLTLTQWSKGNFVNAFRFLHEIDATDARNSIVKSVKNSMERLQFNSKEIPTARKIWKKAIGVQMKDFKYRETNFKEAELTKKASMVCTNCSQSMTLIKDKRKLDIYSWYCSTCRKIASIRDKSWFSKSKLSLPQIVCLTYCWANNYPQNVTMNEAGIRSKKQYLTGSIFYVSFVLDIWNCIP